MKGDEPTTEELATTADHGAAVVSSVEPKISHAVLLTAAQLSRGLFRLLFVIVAARALGPSQFGVYALLLAMVEMLAVATGSGYTDYLTREAAKDERLGWGLCGQLTRLRLAYTIPFTAVVLGGLWTLGYPRAVMVATVWMSLSLIPRSLSEAVQGVLRGTGRYLEFLLVELAFGIALAAGAGLLLVSGGGLREVVATEVAGSVAAAAFALFFALKYRTKQRLRLEKSQLIKASSIFNIYAFVGNLYDRLDILMLSRLAGDYATGIYGAAYRPMGTIQLLPYGVLYSLLPTLSRGTGSDADRQRLEKAMGLLLSAAFVLVLATLAFAKTLVPIVFGTGFAESASALKVLIWAVIPRYLNFALNISLLAAAHERVFAVTSLVCLAVNVITNLLFIPRYSWRAAAVVTIATELVLLIQNIYWLRRLTGSTPMPLGWLRVSLVFALLTGLTVAAAKFVSPVAAGIVCLLVYLAYLYRTGMVAEFAAVWRTAGSSSS